MASSKSLFKGLAAGAVLAAVGTMLVKSNKSADKKAKELYRAAEDITSRVTSKALKLGGVTKAAYGKVVDSLIAEYKGAKHLTDRELADLKDELKESWEDVQAILKKKAKKVTKSE
jgi:gas vesicle protein